MLDEETRMKRLYEEQIRIGEEYIYYFHNARVMAAFEHASEKEKQKWFKNNFGDDAHGEILSENRACKFMTFILWGDDPMRHISEVRE